MATISLQVNHQRQVVEVEPRTLLVELLRERLRLTGTHVGCDTSQCGACTVWVDGKSIKSCTMLAMEADGAEVTTIEGLASNGRLHPLQAAFQTCHGLQCGFCTPGMVMSAGELLARNPRPDESEVRHWLEGNICRCTGYHNIVRAVLAAAEMGASAAGSAGGEGHGVTEPVDGSHAGVPQASAVHIGDTHAGASQGGAR